MQELTEFCIRYNSFLIMTKIQLDKIAIQVKWNSLMKTRLFNYLCEFLYSRVRHGITSNILQYSFSLSYYESKSKAPEARDP